MKMDALPGLYVKFSPSTHGPGRAPGAESKAEDAGCGFLEGPDGIAVHMGQMSGLPLTSCRSKEITSPNTRLRKVLKIKVQIEHLMHNADRSQQRESKQNVYI
jgi:hypothetical protein